MRQVPWVPALKLCPCDHRNWLCPYEHWTSSWFLWGGDGRQVCVPYSRPGTARELMRQHRPHSPEPAQMAQDSSKGRREPGAPHILLTGKLPQRCSHRSGRGQTP